MRSCQIFRSRLTRACGIAGQAQQLSGISSAILKKPLPIIVGMIISGLMRSGSGQAAPQTPQVPQPAPDQGGGLIDILRQIFQQGQPESTNQPGSGSSPWGIPPIGDILGTDRGGTKSPQKAPPMPAPTPVDQPLPQPTDAGGGNIPGGDLLPNILRELEKAIREGRLKPVVVGPFEIGIPGQAGPAGSPRRVETFSARSCAKCSRAAKGSCRSKVSARRCSATGSSPVAMSRRPRSTAFRRCSINSSALSVADVARQAGSTLHANLSAARPRYAA